MNNYRPFAGITPAVKIIIIINVLVFLAVNMIGQRSDVDLVNILGMHLPQSQYFQIYQYITHMFTQEGLTTFSSTCLPCSCSAGYWNRTGPSGKPLTN